MKIIFIRHLQTPGNEKRQYIGRTDESLSDRALEAFRSSKSRYPAVESVIASPMERRSAAIPASLQKGEDPGEWLVLFQHDASAVTPGQSAVIYRDNRIIGGGIIADQRLLKKYSS